MQPILSINAIWAIWALLQLTAVGSPIAKVDDMTPASHPIRAILCAKETGRSSRAKCRDETAI